MICGQCYEDEGLEIDLHETDTDYLCILCSNRIPKCTGTTLTPQNKKHTPTIVGGYPGLPTLIFHITTMILLLVILALLAGIQLDTIQGGI
jgi:hypothetical protein